MSNGVSDMFDRINEEKRLKRLEKFNAHSDNHKLYTIETVIKNLESFKQTNPSLTESAWRNINNSLDGLNDLLN